MPITPRMTPEIQTRLYHETDARFWAQTGYAPGRKLDPQNPTDAHMIPVWQDIYKKVRAEWATGKLITTFDHPAVVGFIQEAAKEFGNAAVAIGAARATPSSDVIIKNAHADDAAAAHARANTATTQAATYQPATASPVLAAQAAQNVAADLAATNIAAAQATAAGLAHAANPEGPPPAPPPPPITPHDTLDALQTAHAADKAASIYNQTPAPDAPVAPIGPTKGASVAVVGGVVAAFALAMLLSSTGGRVNVRGTR